MNLYDRVSNSSRSMSNLPSKAIEPVSSDHDVRMILKTSGAVRNLREQPVHNPNKSVPIVTCTREEDKCILPSSSIGNNISLDINTSRAQVTSGTFPHHTNNPTAPAALPQELRSKLETSKPFAQWDQSSQELIAWFRAAPRPTEPFFLADHLKVIEPGKFFDSIMCDIEAGPSGPRSKYGALMSDLRKLKLLMDGNNSDRSNE